MARIPNNALVLITVISAIGVFCIGLVSFILSVSKEGDVRTITNEYTRFVDINGSEIDELSITRFHPAELCFQGDTQCLDYEPGNCIRYHNKICVDSIEANTIAVDEITGYSFSDIVFDNFSLPMLLGNYPFLIRQPASDTMELYAPKMYFNGSIVQPLRFENSGEIRFCASALRIYKDCTTNRLYILAPNITMIATDIYVSGTVYASSGFKSPVHLQPASGGALLLQLHATTTNTITTDTGKPLYITAPSAPIILNGLNITLTGPVAASTFVSPIETHNGDMDVLGTLTGTDADFSGDVSVGGTLTANNSHIAYNLEVDGNLTVGALNGISTLYLQTLYVDNVAYIETAYTTDFQTNTGTINVAQIQTRLDVSSNAYIKFISGTDYSFMYASDCLDNNMTVVLDGKRWQITGDLYVNGHIYSQNTTFPNCTNNPVPSDIRLKRNIQQASRIESNNIINKLNIVDYEYTPESKLPAGPHKGLIANDLVNIVPRAVKTDLNGYLGIDYNELIPDMIVYIQTLKEQIDELTRQLSLLQPKTNAKPERLAHIQPAIVQDIDTPEIPPEDPTPRAREALNIYSRIKPKLQ